MKFHVNLPELRRLAELLAASKDKADRPLYDRVVATIEKEMESRGSRRLVAVRKAASGGMAGGNGTWF